MIIIIIVVIIIIIIIIIVITIIAIIINRWSLYIYIHLCLVETCFLRVIVTCILKEWMTWLNDDKRGIGSKWKPRQTTLFAYSCPFAGNSRSERSEKYVKTRILRREIYFWILEIYTNNRYLQPRLSNEKGCAIACLTKIVLVLLARIPTCYANLYRRSISTSELISEIST